MKSRAEIEVASNGYIVRRFNCEGVSSLSVYTNVCEALQQLASWICYEPLTIEPTQVQHSGEQPK